MLAENRDVARRFGHQATLSRLLVLTPNLQLPPPERRAWVRWVMYANAYSNLGLATIARTAVRLSIGLRVWR